MGSFCQRCWLAGVAARAYLRLGLVPASTASIEAQATRVKKTQAPQSSCPSARLAATPRYGGGQLQSGARAPTGSHKNPCQERPGFASPCPRREVIDSDARRPYRGKWVRHSYLAVLAVPSGGRANQQDQGNAEAENLNGMTAKLRCLGHKLPARNRLRHDRVIPSGEAPGPIETGRIASSLLPATPDRRTLRRQLQ